MVERNPTPGDRGDSFDPIKQFQNAMRAGPPWSSIVDFATHKSFCGMQLYPRQLTLLKLIYLETEMFTQYDWDTIGAWAEGFKDRTRPMGVQPDIFDRIQYLKNNGYHHFPHVQTVMGRRASKGIIGGVCGAERLGYFFSLDDWQRHFGIVPNAVGELTVIATTQAQAAHRQFSDIRRTVEQCQYLAPHIVANRVTDFYIRTPSDERHIDEMRMRGISLDREFASLYASAAATSSTSKRGGSGFCLDPDTPVLTADLQWVPIRSVQIGDRLVAVDEYPDPGLHRKVRTAVVQAKMSSRKKAYRLTFDDGKTVTCSGDHRWLVRAQRGGRNFRWQVTRGKSAYHSIKVGTEIVELVSPWVQDDSRDAGYLSGVYDGEGHVSIGRSGISVFFSQNPGAVLDKTLLAMKEKGFNPQPSSTEAYRQEHGGAQQWAIRGMAECLRFLGQIRPERLTAKAERAYEGVSIRGKGSTRYEQARHIRTVTGIEELPEQDLIDIQTSTGTFIANGLVSHNCNFYDEFAHQIMGTGSTKSGDEVYAAMQPSLDQFGIHRFTYVPSSPFTKIGRFYQLYQEGSVTMDVYDRREGKFERRSFTEKHMGLDMDEVEEELDVAVADPEMLVVQLPSWETYRDWDRSHTIPMRPNKNRTFPRWKRPVQWDPDGDGPESKSMARIRVKNPEKFKVERGSQFASVEDAYLNEVMVDRMFEKPWWRDELVPQEKGKFSIVYRAHGDPSRTNANFGWAIGHMEDAPCDGCGWDPNEMPPGTPPQVRYSHNCKSGGRVLPHVIFDKLHVWKPEDFPDHTVNYVQVGRDIDQFLRKFPSIDKLTYDQYAAFGLVDQQRLDHPHMHIFEKTFTMQENQRRFERFKAAINLGLVHSYRDNFFDDGMSLLEQELKFLQEKNGKVDKQEIGPVTTKDLSDAVMVCAVDLLEDHLERWYKGRTRGAFGSTHTAGLKSGREQERMALAGVGGREAPADVRAIRSRSNRNNLERFNAGRGTVDPTRGVIRGGRAGQTRVPRAERFGASRGAAQMYRSRGRG